ncbi:MAG TPA: DNRLRE domain-containing protein [Chitinophagales bacterium]|nr:DNRLRE domain-containing protein [Chitinophagales bacterium]
MKKTLPIVAFILGIQSIYSQYDTACFVMRVGPQNSSNVDLLSYLPTRVLPSPDYFLCVDWTYNNVPGESRDIMKFDLSDIPAGSTVTSALLNLYPDPTSSNGSTGQPMYGPSNTSYLQRVTSSWDTSNVDWNNQPSTTTTDEIVLPQSTIFFQPYLNIDLKSFVQQWVSNPAQNYGMMLKLAAPDPYNSLIFSSGNQADTILRPLLSICYLSNTTGIADNMPVPSIKTYPNPANDKINIDLGNGYISEIRIYNLLGQEVITEKPAPDNVVKLAVGQLPKGPYLVKVTDISGRSFFEKQIIN